MQKMIMGLCLESLYALLNERFDVGRVLDHGQRFMASTPLEMGGRTMPSYICVRVFWLRACKIVLWLMGRRLGSCRTGPSGYVNQIDFGTRIPCRK